MTGRMPGASPVFEGTVVAVDVVPLAGGVDGDRTLLFVEADGIGVGYRIGPLEALEGPGVGDSPPWQVADRVLIVELTPSDAGFVVLGRIAG